MGCVCDNRVLTAGGGVRSRSISDGICDAEGGSYSSPTNRRRFSTRPISRSSALDSAFSVFGSFAGGSACSETSGRDRVEARTASWLTVNTLFVSSSLRVRVGPRTSRSLQNPENFGLSVDGTPYICVCCTTRTRFFGRVLLFDHSLVVSRLSTTVSEADYLVRNLIRPLEILCDFCGHRTNVLWRLRQRCPEINRQAYRAAESQSMPCESNRFGDSRSIRM